MGPVQRGGSSPSLDGGDGMRGGGMISP